MKILCIDTSSKLCSIAILEDSNLITEITLDNGLTHSETLMPTIRKIFRETNLELKNIDLLVCDIGPGSFTGIRIGVATTKAFSDSMQIPSIGVNSLESLCYNVKEEGYICSLIDAKHDNVYFSLFEYKNNSYVNVEEPQSNSIEEVISILNKYKGTISFVGDGSINYKEKILEKLPNANFTDKNEISGYSLGLAGLTNYKNGNIQELLPMYLKKSQAERMLEKFEK